jgi:hypothetical protein
LPDYRFDPATGLWRHRDAPDEPPLRLSDVHYDADGVMRYPSTADRAAESELDRYLDQARERFAAAPDGALPEDAARMSADFEHLRWFDLPAACLA